jgi:hypothetical protein
MKLEIGNAMSASKHPTRSKISWSILRPPIWQPLDIIVTFVTKYSKQNIL